MDTYVENLLAPVSVENPAGRDLSDSLEMLRIEESMKGVPEDEFKHTPAEPPDWRKLRKECEGYLARSKHLKVSVALTCALLKTKGLEGFRDGLKIVLGLTRDYWDTVHPRLDPTDGNDPTGRLNILGTLKLPRGMPTDWMRVMNHLVDVPLAGGVGQEITLALVDESRKQGGTGKGMEQSSVDAVIRATPVEQLQATIGHLLEIKESVEALDALLTQKVGAQTAESFSELTATLARMSDVVAPFVQMALQSKSAGEDSAAADPVGAGSGAPDATSGGGGGVRGIRSRDDIVRTLDLMCDYYARTEPSSPVPYILRRAQKMATMDFVALMNELSLADRSGLKSAMGAGLPPEEPTPGS